MPRVKDSIRNPLPHGSDTWSKHRAKCSYTGRRGYDYHNNLITIHPSYQWCKYVAYVYYSEKKGLKPTRGGYETIKYGPLRDGRKRSGTNICMWNAIANAGYIEYNPHRHCYEITAVGCRLISLIESHFGPYKWNR